MSSSFFVITQLLKSKLKCHPQLMLSVSRGWALFLLVLHAYLDIWCVSQVKLSILIHIFVSYYLMHLLNWDHTDRFDCYHIVHNEMIFQGVRHISFICYLYVCQDGTESSVWHAPKGRCLCRPPGRVTLYLFVHASERVERGCGCGVLVWFLQ